MYEASHICETSTEPGITTVPRESLTFENSVFLASLGAIPTLYEPAGTGTASATLVVPSDCFAGLISHEEPEPVTAYVPSGTISQSASLVSVPPAFSLYNTSLNSFSTAPAYVIFVVAAVPAPTVT